MTKKNKTQSFYDNLKIGEEIYVLKAACHVPDSVIKECSSLPYVIKGTIKKKNCCINHMSISIKTGRKIWEVNCLRLYDISRNKDTLVRRQIRDLKKRKSWLNKQLERIEELLDEG